MQSPESEAAFQKRLCKLAKLQGWKVCESHGPRNKPRTPGFVDLVLVKGGRAVLFVELKADGGKCDDEQGGWHAALVNAGARVRVWRPRDWREIEEELGR